MTSKAKTRRSVLVILSDTHAGCNLALMNPDTVLFSEDEFGNPVPWQPTMSKSQEYLWNLFIKNVQKSIEIADGCEMMVIHTGDACHGIKYPQSLVSTRLSDQVVIAEYNTRPFFEYKNLMYYRQVIGTQAHNAGEGSTELLLSQMVQARHPTVDIKPLYHGLLDYKGVTVDYAHHGPSAGIRDWLKGNVARLYLRSLMQHELNADRIPPRLVYRAHYHEPVYELLKIKEFISEIYVTPSWSMLGDHATQVAQSPSEITHGFNVHVIENNEIAETFTLHETVDIRTVEVIA